MNKTTLYSLIYEKIEETWAEYEFLGNEYHKSDSDLKYIPFDMII